MGNHMSCMSPAVASCHKQNLIKIFHSETSALSELEGPVTAAEVMMDFPAQFLCSVSSAASTGNRNICAMPADEELRAPELYMLLPMQKLNTRFSVANMAFLAVLASWNSSRKKARLSQGKVTPLPASMSAADEGLRTHMSTGSQSFKQSRANLRAFNVQEPPPFLKGGMCRSKSWMPKLETITEHSVLFCPVIEKSAGTPPIPSQAPSPFPSPNVKCQRI